MKKTSWSIALVICLWVVLEGLCAGLWHWRVSEPERRIVETLSGQRSDSNEAIPNTFWHHSLNPRHEDLVGQINRKGTKGPDFELPKPAGELRVLCIGDSTVEAIHHGPEEAFPAYLEEMLKTSLPKSYKSVRVINAGVRNHNSAFTLAYFEFHLLHFQPDVVIFKGGYNDYAPFLRSALGYDYTNAFPVPYHLLENDNPFWRLARFSYVARVFDYVVFRSQVREPIRNFGGDVSNDDLLRFDFQKNLAKIFLFRENIRSLVLLCKGRHIPIILLDLPVNPDPQLFVTYTINLLGGRYRDLMHLLDGELTRVAHEEGVPLVRTAEELQKDDFDDHIHLRGSGNTKIAKRLAPVVLKNL